MVTFFYCIIPGTNYLLKVKEIKRVQNRFLEDANYGFKINDSTNILSQSRLGLSEMDTFNLMLVSNSTLSPMYLIRLHNAFLVITGHPGLVYLPC